MESATIANDTGSGWDNALGFLLDGSQLRSSVLLGIAGIAGLLVLSSVVSPRVGGDEPPVLKPTIPLVGHIINLLRHGPMFQKHYRKYNLPAATLPMLNGKMYAIWDTAIIQGIFRKKGFSIEQFAANFAANVSGLDQHMHDLYHDLPMTMEGIELFGKHLKGESLRKINITAIRSIEERLHGQFHGGDWLEIPNVFLWLRDTMTLAGSRALWGSRHPLSTPELAEDFWLFESQMLIMALDLYPRFTAPRAFAGRARVQAALGEFYKAGYDQDQDTSDVIRERAKMIRSYNIDDEMLGKMESPVLAVSLSNTVPTLFWVFAYIVSMPGLADRLREELRGLMRRDGDEATLDVTQWESRCPLLMSCYRETLRFSSTATVTRRVAEDTSLVGSDGRAFTIKANTDVQVSSAASHTNPAVWGADVDEFDPERFLCFTEEPGAQHVKEKKASYFPFGGGRHMCPGRYFAFTEILTYVAVLLLGHDIEPADGGPWKAPPQKTNGSLAEAVAKPVRNGEGFDARIRRKAGWENVRWHFHI